MDEFEKMDNEMMEAMKKIRNQKMPEGLLRHFSTKVEREILKRHLQPASPGFGGAPFAALAIALLVFGVAIWKLSSPQAVKVIPVQAEVRTLIPSSPPPPNPAPAVTSAPSNEAEISNEIEALKEVGAWSEDDEKKLGIAAEETFSELELAFDDNSEIPGSVLGAG